MNKIEAQDNNDLEKIKNSEKINTLPAKETNKNHAENEKLINEQDDRIKKKSAKTKVESSKRSIVVKTVRKLHPSSSPASKKERKITKTLAIVLIVYLVCW